MALADRKVEAAMDTFRGTLSADEIILGHAVGSAPLMPAQLLLTSRRLVLVQWKLPMKVVQGELSLLSVREAHYDSSMMGNNHHSLFVTSREGDFQFRFGSTNRVNAEGGQWPKLILDAVHKANGAGQASPSSASPDLAEQLAALAGLREQGALSESEFTAAKQRLLGS